MTNTLKLKAKIVENGYTILTLCKKLKISRAAFSSKLNNKTSFYAEEIRDIANVLKLTLEEIYIIFLANK